MKETLMDIKVVGKSGQISLGKALAGIGFIVQTQPSGDILLKHAVVMPVNDRWLQDPVMKERLARADKWMRTNAPKETDLEKLEAKALAIAKGKTRVNAKPKVKAKAKPRVRP
jgi:hypothetical protein